MTRLFFWNTLSSSTNKPATVKGKALLLLLLLLLFLPKIPPPQAASQANPFSSSPQPSKHKKSFFSSYSSLPFLLPFWCSKNRTIWPPFDCWERRRRMEEERAKNLTASPSFFLWAFCLWRKDGKSLFLLFLLLGSFFNLPHVQFIEVWKKQTFFIKMGAEKATFSKNGCEKGKVFPKMGVKRAQLFLKKKGKKQTSS